MYATLPDPVLRLPREKPLPKEKQLSRWENFAKVKGIQKKKTSNMVYDEGLKEYKPRFGYGSKHKLEDWAIEVDKNQDPNIDVRAEKKELEKEKKGMAQMKERRNQEEANAKNAGKNPKFVRKAQLEKQLTESKKATASLGKFDKTLVNDVKIKGVKRQKETSSVGNIALEKEVGMKLLKKIESGAKILNVNQVRVPPFSRCYSRSPPSSPPPALLSNHQTSTTATNLMNLTRLSRHTPKAPPENLTTKNKTIKRVEKRLADNSFS